MIAYVDESLREGDDGLYLIAAAVVVEGDLTHARAAARGVLLPKQPRFHWRNESEPQRAVMLAAIASLEHRALIYACRPAPKRQERGRALCLDRMLWDFREEGVTEVVFESRDHRNDRKDAKTIGHALRAGRAPVDLRYRFLRPTGEPLLWIADAIAGAAAADLVDERRYLRSLPETMVRLTEFSP